MPSGDLTRPWYERAGKGLREWSMGNGLTAERPYNEFSTTYRNNNDNSEIDGIIANNDNEEDTNDNDKINTS